MNKRWWPVGRLVVLGLLVLGGCSPAPDSPAVLSTGPPAATPTAAPPPTSTRTEMVSTPAVKVDQTLRLYGPSGDLLGSARAPLDERHTYVQHGLAVGPDGAIYALLTRPDHVQVVRLEMSTDLAPVLPTPARRGG